MEKYYFTFTLFPGILKKDALVFFNSFVQPLSLILCEDLKSIYVQSGSLF